MQAAEMYPCGSQSEGSPGTHSGNKSRNTQDTGPRPRPALRSANRIALKDSDGGNDKISGYLGKMKLVWRVRAARGRQTQAGRC